MNNPDQDASNKNKDIRAESETPQRITRMMQDFEMFAMQKGGNHAFDFSRLTSEQVDTVLNLMRSNEENAFQYHMRRLEYSKDINGR